MIIIIQIYIYLIQKATNGCVKFLDDKSHPVHRKFFATKYDVIILHRMDICMFGLAKLVDNPSIIWLSTSFFTAQMALMAGTWIDKKIITCCLKNFDKLIKNNSTNLLYVYRSTVSNKLCSVNIGTVHRSNDLLAASSQLASNLSDDNTFRVCIARQIYPSLYIYIYFYIYE